MEKTVVRTEAAPAPFQGAPYNQAIVAGDAREIVALADGTDVPYRQIGTVSGEALLGVAVSELRFAYENGLAGALG